MEVRDARLDDLPGILEIFNDAIVNTTAVWRDAPEDLAVDWFEGEMDRSGGVDAGYSTPLAFVERRDGTATWAGTVQRPADDRLGYSVRVRPRHPLLLHPNETGLVLWAE